MKILFGIQGTGNGHVSRAREILPFLQQYGEVTILVSGIQADVQLGASIRYQLYGFSFIFGKRGGVDIWQTIKKTKLIRLLLDIKNLPVKNYDLVINDFEPVSAWACKIRKVPCIALSHQSAFLSSKTPRPSQKSFWAELILKYYAPSTGHFSFHFKSYDQDIYTPVIRSEIRELEPKDLGHITVYLPAYADEFLLSYFEQLPDVRWQVFSKHCTQAYQQNNVSVRPISNFGFNQSLANAHGLITGGGFEGPAEALYLGKKLLLIPMKNQYEQQCNAAAATKMGIPVIQRIGPDFVVQLKAWLQKPFTLKPNFPDQTNQIVADLMKRFSKIS
ncbi:MAG: glycosyl transferase [Sphingobacteriaceae bacterium]|nr:glycosyl transferase [Sphingobacteriaceae bacterium]